MMTVPAMSHSFSLRHRRRQPPVKGSIPPFLSSSPTSPSFSRPYFITTTTASGGDKTGARERLGERENEGEEERKRGREPFAGGYHRLRRLCREGERTTVVPMMSHSFSLPLGEAITGDNTPPLSLFLPFVPFVLLPLVHHHRAATCSGGNDKTGARERMEKRETTQEAP
uniref:Uncharacterized protein n=1 Tax=Nelumbo nucifera TaxID=4432 RepID=A0A822Y0N6_NELNU|nr:TPA_asm: hypothetical protein HUJ06_024661 [Nelumbo nucifera]